MLWFEKTGGRIKNKIKNKGKWNKIKFFLKDKHFCNKTFCWHGILVTLFFLRFRLWKITDVNFNYRIHFHKIWGDMNKNLPSSAFFSHSTNFFICSRKTLFPLAMWASVYHFKITSSLKTSATGGQKINKHFKPDKLYTLSVQRFFIFCTEPPLNTKPCV